MNQDSAKKLSLSLPLTFLVGLFGLSCSTPEAPKVTFEDRPSSYSVSKYQGAATDSSRHYLSNSDEFIGANQSSLNRAIADLSAADQARAEERARRAASASSSAALSSSSGSSQYSSRSSEPRKVPCSACSGRGGHSPGYEGFLAFGANFKKCHFCDGTGRVWVR